MTAAQAVAKWKLSKRRTQLLLTLDRVPGAKMVGGF
jgi:hypothetical protein